MHAATRGGVMIDSFGQIYILSDLAAKNINRISNWKNCFSACDSRTATLASLCPFHAHKTLDDFAASCWQKTDANNIMTNRNWTLATHVFMKIMTASLEYIVICVTLNCFVNYPRWTKLTFNDFNSSWTTAAPVSQFIVQMVYNDLEALKNTL